MIIVSRRVVCPQCRRQVGVRQEDFRGDSARPSWNEGGDIEADFICSRCRKKMEEELAERAAYLNRR